MNPVILACIIVSVIGVLSGLLLAAASKVMAVDVDERAEGLAELLPGANCGACGFSGCYGYAAALSDGQTQDTALCAPGGNEVSKALAAYLGVSAGEVLPTAAVVLCQGINSNAGEKMDYVGVKSCKMAVQLFGGPKDCIYGCVGFGDCIEACPYNAIHICDGVARVNPLACRACKKCVASCPKKIIEMIPLHLPRAAVLCKNRDKGNVTRKECKAGCLGCMRCQKICPLGAVTVIDNVAHVDYEKCTGCGECAKVCPVHCIDIMLLGEPAAERA